MQSPGNAQQRSHFCQLTNKVCGKVSSVVSSCVQCAGSMQCGALDAQGPRLLTQVAADKCLVLSMVLSP